jgi:hypothetical protein
MSKNEEKFEEFLKQNHIEYERPDNQNYFIDNVPFNKNGKYRPDFYLPQKKLYIEVKGEMTLRTVSILKYLLNKRLPNNFCILQMTSELWIQKIYNDEKYSSNARKISASVEQQFEEIKNMSAKKLHDLSVKRLEEYVEFFKERYRKWCTKK